MKIIYDSSLPEELCRRIRRAEKPVMPLKKAYKVLGKKSYKETKNGKTKTNSKKD